MLFRGSKGGECKQIPIVSVRSGVRLEKIPLSLYILASLRVSQDDTPQCG